MGQERDRGKCFTAEGIALIEEAMQAKGWDREDLAGNAEFQDKKTIDRALQGIAIDQKSIKKIANALGLNFNDLIDLPAKKVSTHSKSSLDRNLMGWQKICGEMLAKQKEARQLRKEATSIGAEVNVYVPLDLLEHKEQTRSKQDKSDSDQRNQYQEPKVVKTFEHDDFLLSLVDRQSKNKHIAIVGEAGAGKTTLLARIADELDKKQKLQIFVSLADLQGRSLEDHIYGKWLSEALGVQKDSINAEQKNDLFQQFQSGEIWLLLDGLDEMRAKSSADALEKINREIREVIGQSRVVLTSRLNVWDTYLNRLSGFDTFRMGDFSPEQVDKFIGDWFVEAGKPESAPILQAKLKEPNRDRIRDMVRHPLRLALLCQAFDRDLNTELPETKAGLYDLFVLYFYEWKPNNVDEDLTQDTLREELHLALGKLAIAGIDGDAGFRLSRSLAIKEMGDRLFELAIRLNWLIPIERDENDRQVYSFFHTTFQEYFAALAIPSWRFFLHHDIYNLENGIYRVFKPEWIEIIILWIGNQLQLGHTDIVLEFIYSLSDFNDLMGLESPYSYQAHFIATICVGEIRSDKISENIINKTINIWITNISQEINQSALKSLKFINFSLIESIFNDLIKVSESNKNIAQLAVSLGEVYPNSLVVKSCLKKVISEYAIAENHIELWVCINDLIKISGIEGFIEIESIFFNVLEKIRLNDFNEDYFFIVFFSLKSIAKTNKYHTVVKKILFEIILKTDSASSIGGRINHEQALYALAEVDPELSRKVTNVWLAKSEDESSLFANVKLLLKASEPSLEPFIVIYRLLDSDDIEILRNCIEYIESMGSKKQNEIVNSGILEKLIEMSLSLISNGDPELICRHIAKALGNIGIASQQVIETLENIVESMYPKRMDYGSIQAAISLHKLGCNISKYETFFMNKLITYNEPETAKVIKTINHNNMLATQILIGDILTRSGESWDSYECLIDTIPNSSIKVLSLIVSFLKNNYQNALNNVKKYGYDSIEVIEENYHQLIWLCSKNMSYPDFYKAWHSQIIYTHLEIAETNPSNNTNKIQILESQFIDCEVIQKELDRKANHPEIRCLVVDVRHLEQESDPNVIAKKLTNKIFNSIGRRIPVVQDVSCLERELLNLKFDLGVEKLAIALYGKSPNEAIHQLCQSLTDSIPIRPFTGEKSTQELIFKINAWLSEM
ncbi:MAG: hypothetical protein DCF19_05540 [Pseudanabaena frigida]|uniref:NACHT domain-containing protein n=1 Tax=Pseudanabaena frigida TaxID=945775 RepID=A0A2W4Y8U8_9CYAN|nr:MAG: hypothetical protein DCF19_05540 [Pseudanabaena frigida]